MVLITIETRTDFGNGKIYNEVFDIEVQNPKDKEEIINEIKSIIDDYNNEEIIRHKHRSDYMKAPVRKFVEFVGVISVNNSASWVKLTGYFNGFTMWKDENTGYVVLSEFKPKQKKLGNMFCKHCNRFFDKSSQYEHHKTLPSHNWSKDSLITYPFFDLKFEQLREMEYEKGFD